MSILALQKAKDANAGFATDFIEVLGGLTSILKQHQKLKIVTNAGGMNPRACALAAKRKFSRKPASKNGLRSSAATIFCQSSISFSPWTHAESSR